MAETYSLQIDAGATFDGLQFRWLEDDKTTPVDLTGWTPKAQIRLTASDALALELTCAISSGLITVSATAAQTATLTEAKYVWALEMSKAGQVVRLVEGKVYVSPEVVR
jgi:hypothetical protein